MKTRNFLFLVLFLSLFLTSCGDQDGESANVDINATSSIVTNAGEGAEVQDPADPQDVNGPKFIQVKDGYFSFHLSINNKSSKGLVITNISYKVLEFGNNDNSLGEGTFSPTSIFARSHPLQDAARRYMILVPPGGTTSGIGPLGISVPSVPTDDNPGSNGLVIPLFFIDGLQRDDLRNFLHNIELTVEGIFTSVSSNTSQEDPFQFDQGFFRKIVFFTVK